MVYSVLFCFNETNQDDSWRITNFTCSQD
jgi:hypothetical protein